VTEKKRGMEGKNAPIRAGDFAFVRPTSTPGLSSITSKTIMKSCNTQIPKAQDFHAYVERGVLIADLTNPL
jgi:hypothetical protein